MSLNALVNSYVTQLTISGVPAGLPFLTDDDKVQLESLRKGKAYSEGQILVYEFQRKLLKMVHERALAAVNHPDLKIKDFCGYDDRLAMNDAELSRWLQTTEGMTAFGSGVLGPRTAETQPIGAAIPFRGHTPAAVTVPDALNNICMNRAKTCRHFKWRENARDTINAMMKATNAFIETYEEQEQELYDDAETREATKEYDAENMTTALF